MPNPLIERPIHPFRTRVAATMSCVALVPLFIGISLAFSQIAPRKVDCSDPNLFTSSSCQNPADIPATMPTTAVSLDPTAGRMTDTQVYVDSGGTRPRSSDAMSRQYETYAPDPITDFQRLAGVATGEKLSIFGRSIFDRPPSTFAPGNQIAAPADYIVGPGDRLIVRLWGPETFTGQLTVDPSGAIYIPKVGAVHVTGLRFDELEAQVTMEVSRIYKNFRLSVSLSDLRSIQVYVVGEARKPGAYTISAQSTVMNALFASGGPNPEGSLRHVQVRRGQQVLSEFDLYDVVLRGDTSHDLRLQTGDIIFIPAVKSQIALAGSVHHPAIYELGNESTLGAILQLAGGLSATAATDRISLDRIEAGHDRQTINIALNSAGLAMTLRNGDVIYANHMTAAYANSVSIRGNLANPARFAWHPGMRLSDIIPDRSSLLTNDYWHARNSLGVPTPLFEPLGKPANKTATPALNDPYEQSQVANGTLSSQTTTNAAELSSSTANTRTGLTQNSGVLTQGAVLGDGGVRTVVPLSPEEVAPPARNLVIIPAAEINWSYAVIERLDPENLKSTLIPFNLGKLVRDHDPTQNLELRPGDVVTILSQDDVLTSQETHTKYIRLEGEFAAPGVYSALPNETLADLIKRAGGITTHAYLYGSTLTRTSARIFQQHRLDEYISTLSLDMERASAVRAASAPTGVLDPNALASQRSMIDRIRQLRATGRVVLEFPPENATEASIPSIPLEDGDVFHIPTKPNTVSVIGAVYGQNVFLYNPKRTLEDYVAQAGNPNRIADAKHAFIIRADGSVYNRGRAQGAWSNHFKTATIYPGDSIVIPEKLIKPSIMRQLTDYSQILSSFGLAAAAISVIR